PEDKRNLEAAAILDRLAKSVESVPPTTLNSFFELYEDYEGEELSEELRQVGFHSDPKTAEDFCRSYIASRTNGRRSRSKTRTGFRFCSAAHAPHAKPCHDTVRSTFLDLDFLISELQPSLWCVSAPPERCDRTTEQPTMQASFASDRNAQRWPGGATCDE